MTLNKETKPNLFRTIRFNISHLFALSLNVKQFYRTPSGATTPDRVDLGAMTMKEYPTFPKAPGLEPHHQIVFVISSRLDGRVYPSAVMQLLYSITPTDGARILPVVEILS